MIAKLSGRLDSIDKDSLIINVGGVGYLVFCSSRTIESLDSENEIATLYIETHVREDHIHLYGFAEPIEKQWFNLLTKVQGVGAKVGLGLLGTLSPSQLRNAVISQDTEILGRANGVGPRLASRILSELKGKIAELPTPDPDTSIDLKETENGLITDAVSALMNLGYRRSDAFSAISEVSRQLGENASMEALIRSGLKELSE
ncbi:MAG: Holliday junction branch migration protein RuvA [Betaproteobacteria bacterium]